MTRSYRGPDRAPREEELRARNVRAGARCSGCGALAVARFRGASLCGACLLAANDAPSGDLLAPESMRAGAREIVGRRVSVWG